MKLRKLFLSLLLSGVSLGSAAAQQASTDKPARLAARNASQHIGDDAVEMPEAEQPAYQQVQHETPYETSIAPAAMTYGSSCGSGGCSTGSCGCGSSSFSSCGCGPTAWFDAELLLWFSSRRNSPELLTSAAGASTGIPGTPGVETAVGGIDGINLGLLPGYRVSTGMYFDNEKTMGVSGRVFGIFNDSNTTTRVADGTNTVALPYFNLVPPTPAVYFVGFPGVFTGRASVTTNTSLVSGDSSLRFLLSGAGKNRTELIGGYTFLRLNDTIKISTTSSPGPVLTDDIFDAKNTFHGGHLGVENMVAKRRVSLTTLAKIAFGNMREAGSIGSLPGSVPHYAQNRQGFYARDTFAFIPELGIKGGLKITNNLSLTTGYTFLYISKAALAGNQIEPVINVAPPPVVPFQFREGSTWFQGVDVGLNYTF